MNLFVPGRICLFGEHSDWAGGYRRINADIERGRTIILGTNQGLYAEVEPHPDHLIFSSTLPDGSDGGSCELPMDTEVLLQEAQEGGFFSYVAGVAYQVMTHYRVGGLKITNYKTDLPVKKGLSSSAALSVLVARAFNRTYDLKMTVRGEMEFAYRGEITTPSRCGRMDQGCAYGNRPVKMIFDGEQVDVEELRTGEPLYFVIVDLCAGKDTKKILDKLNNSYPFADDEQQQRVQEYLGPINRNIIERASEALEEGDAERIGELMVEAQAEFDRCLQPACPSELSAPVLHHVLNYEPIQEYIWGGKGVGSQGDGSAQFIARDAESQQKVIEILERDLDMPALKLVLDTTRQVRRAVIPAAGFEPGLFPASKGIKKELFPVVDEQGRAVPAILKIVEEATGAGIERVNIVVQPEDRQLFEEVFHEPTRPAHLNKLSRSDRDFADYLQDIGQRITFVEQPQQEGFGHAVLCAAEQCTNEPFLLMLGDHLYSTENELSCAKQLLKVYEKYGTSVVGLKQSPLESVHRFGCVQGMWHDDEDVVDVREVVEKPTREYAADHLTMNGLGEETFLTLNGLYVLDPVIFSYLKENVDKNLRQRGEFELTPCLDRLRREEGLLGYVVDGRRYTIGSPEVYQQTVKDYPG